MKRWGLFIAAMSISLLFWYAGISQAATRAVTADSAGAINIPISELSATLRYYEFSGNGTKVRFFAVLGADGLPRVAFDACEVCGGRLGYEQKGTDIQCRVCGRVFRIDQIGTKNRTPGCWPSYLPFSVKNKVILIKTGDMERGRALFN
jgi:uncharacterized membrane protein